MKTSVPSVYFFFNRSTDVVISEEQKAFFYLLPQKACVQEHVPAKQTFYPPLLKQIQVFFSGCF